MLTAVKQIRIVCVDDNPLVTEALKAQFLDVLDIDCVGTASSADELLAMLQGDDCPDVVVMDYDMPGLPSLEAIGELQTLCRDSRVLMFSGYIGKELIDRALDAGAWGYVAKVDSHDDLANSIRQVAAGSFAFSPSVEAARGS